MRATLPRAAPSATARRASRRNAPLIPLAGLPRDHIATQMRAFRDGQRPATVMHQIAKGYSDAQIDAIAAVAQPRRRGEHETRDFSSSPARSRWPAARPQRLQSARGGGRRRLRRRHRGEVHPPVGPLDRRGAGGARIRLRFLPDLHLVLGGYTSMGEITRGYDACAATACRWCATR